jgi:primosomal protein N'
MDSNMSDLIGGVLSNPEMMKKVTTLLPLVSQMMKSSDNTAAAPPAIPPPAQASPPAPSPSPPPQINQADIMANENVAAAIQNLIAALNSSNHSNQNNQNSQTNQQPLQASQNNNIDNNENLNQNIQNIISAFAQQPSQPASGFSSAAGEKTDTLNIEKALGTLQTVSAVASPENDHRAKLLLSLKPFLKDSRKDKIDTAIKYINAAKIFSMFGKNGFI